MRQRVEDLGRISILIDHILQKDVFEIVTGRNKDFPEHFFSKDKDKQYEILHNFVYGVSDIKDQLYQILSIAEGTDDLNALFERDPMDS